MGTMKRARRRHHEQRVKDKYRRAARDVLSSPRLMTDAQRQKYIERTAVRMAHHPRHQCSICRLGPKELKCKHEREVQKKAPMEDE